MGHLSWSCEHRDYTPAIEVADALSQPANPDPRGAAEHRPWCHGDVELRVFNALGREVVRLVSGFRPGGPGEVRWTPADHQGRLLPSGVYFARFESERTSTVQRVVVVR